MKNIALIAAAAGILLATAGDADASRGRRSVHSTAAPAPVGFQWTWFGLAAPQSEPPKRAARSRGNGRRPAKRGKVPADERSGTAAGFVVQHARVAVAGLDSVVTGALSSVAAHFGVKPIVTSGAGGHGHARRSMHRGGHAADFKVPGVSKRAVVAYLKTLPGVGGVGIYGGNSIIHVDSGVPREWSCSGGGRYSRSRCRFAMR